MGEALRRVNEGAAMLRTKGEAGTGDISEAIKHVRKVKAQIQEVVQKKDDAAFLELRLHLTACRSLCSMS